MNSRSAVDLALNVFAKPLQTSLSILSLLRHSGQYIDTIYLQFEPYGSAFDTASPYVVAEYLGEQARIYQPKYWFELKAADPARYNDPEYRLSVRYQHAFENSDKRYLLTIHNDVLVMKDIVGAMLEHIDGHFAVGQIGQCWNCPAANAEAVAAALPGRAPCTPEAYAGFSLTPDELTRLYRIAAERGVFVRPYPEGWTPYYAENGWPLPECRVSEWACLTDLSLTRPLTVPNGPVPPFGAFEPCGPICLDTAVGWFRELNRRGLRAKHLDIAPYLKHWVGNGKMTRAKYLKAEDNARRILERSFPDFVSWCKNRKNGMF